MAANWTWRLATYLLLTLLGVIFIFPSLGVYNGLPSFLQKIFPSKAINLGLDLKGGMHLLLMVETDKAIENNLQIIRQNTYYLRKVQSYLK